MKTAQEALAESMANKEKIDYKNKRRSMNDHEKFLDDRKKNDDQWIKKCKDRGEAIINLMVENGVQAGRKYKTNRYYGGIHDCQYGHPAYMFENIVTQDAIKEVIGYFNNLGYGCEIEEATIDNKHLMDIYHEQGLVESIYYDIVDKQRFGCYKTQYGTMYLWVIDPNEASAQDHHNKEISW